MENGPQVLGSQNERAAAVPAPSLAQEEEIELVVEQDLKHPACSVADHGIAWQGRRHVWLGRICAIRLCGGRAVFVGPHWYCTLLMLAVIVGVGLMFIFRVALGLHVVHVVGGALALLGSAEALLRCALLDPGILLPHPSGPGGAVQPTQLLPSTGERQCSACHITQPRGAMHCEFCHVCVAGWDHHCPWMGKCIGEKNLKEFYAFLCTSMTSLAYIVIVTMLSS